MEAKTADSTPSVSVAMFSGQTKSLCPGDLVPASDFSFLSRELQKSCSCHPGLRDLIFAGRARKGIYDFQKSARTPCRTRHAGAAELAVPEGKTCHMMGGQGWQPVLGLPVPRTSGASVTPTQAPLPSL